MERVIENSLDKLIKLELENKNLRQKNFQATDQGLNPQYRRPPIHILQRERKEQ